MDPRLILIGPLLLGIPNFYVVGNGLRERGGIVTHVFPAKRKKSRVAEIVGIVMMIAAAILAGVVVWLAASLLRPIA